MLARARLAVLVIGIVIGLAHIIISEPKALFSAEHEGVNETKLGIPPDTFSPDVLEVTEGDNVTVHFYNLDTTDRHTFTIGAPYNINEDLLPEKMQHFHSKELMKAYSDSTAHIINLQCQES